MAETPRCCQIIPFKSCGRAKGSLALDTLSFGPDKAVLGSKGGVCFSPTEHNLSAANMMLCGCRQAPLKQKSSPPLFFHNSHVPRNDKTGFLTVSWQ